MKMILKKSKKPLALSRETIRALNSDTLQAVMGGKVAQCSVACGETMDVSICECVSYQLSCGDPP